jgi:hypothetical protein
MRRVAALIIGMGLALASAPALACERHYGDTARGYDQRAHGYEDERGYAYEDRRYEDERYDERAYDDDARYAPPPYGASPWYADGRRPARICDCEPGGAVRLSDSFFYDAGGVGPIPDGGWYGGGGYVVAGGFGASSARAFSSASASSHASISFRGGRHYGGYGHKGGGYGGKGRSGKGH